ncbi:MAG: solute:sodium symporter family transporter [candidate division KSB1 bacterium]|nr:solute:sodium symporter family transporter [candidate division KSB1 bacterium]MDZ7302376.1 solute:sodium symporter family transporter [candidate division KSB1 bacterium]
MELKLLDILLFLAFFAVVVGVSMYKSRKEESGEDFFLASRGLTWPFIGLSLIAANISTEHFVGMAGQGAGIAGMAVASYEWMAAITLVFVAIFFLPKFLRSGIFTIPEYLEYRYNPTARALMAFYTMLIYVGVTIAAVVYSGALALSTIFDLKLLHAVWLVGGIAAIYTIWGGLKAVAWADLFQGSALILGGAVTMVLGFIAVGGVGKFFEANQDKLHMILPSDHPVLPWTALVIGLWIPNFYYWGLNQYITQRTLAAKTLKQGQLGVIFAAFLKLLIPFIIIFPGIMAFQLYREQLTAAGATTDAAYPLLIRNLVTTGLRGFIFAAIAGAVISSLASMLNSASTIFTMDLYKRHWQRTASERALITMGRATTAIFVLIGCFIAPQLANPRFKGIFNYIQEFQGFLSPGVLAAFIFGLFIKRAPASAGVAALILCPIIYGLLLIFFGEIAFLNRIAITFIVIFAAMAVITMRQPLSQPVTLPVRKEFDMRPAPTVVWLGTVVIVITLALYGIFW